MGLHRGNDNMKNLLKDWAKTMGKMCLFLTGWILLIHEGSHYITCLVFNGNPTYHITSVTCNVTGFNAFIVAIMPYIIGLGVMLFITKIWVRMAIFCDIVGNFAGSITGEISNDYTTILHVNTGFYAISIIIVITALIITMKEVKNYYETY